MVILTFFLLSNIKIKPKPIVNIDYKYNNVMNWEALKGKEMYSK